MIAQRPVLVDSNVLLDAFARDSEWYDWSTAALTDSYGRLAINPVIYAEVSAGFDHVEEVDRQPPEDDYLRLPLPYSAAFLADKAFLAYRRAGGIRRSPLPDFFIGAHAAVERLALLTRDPARYRAYFPKLELIAP